MGAFYGHGTLGSRYPSFTYNNWNGPRDWAHPMSGMTSETGNNASVILSGPFYVYTNNPDKHEDWEQMMHTDILNFTRGDNSKVCVCVCVCVCAVLTLTLTITHSLIALILILTITHSLTHPLTLAHAHSHSFMNYTSVYELPLYECKYVLYIYLRDIVLIILPIYLIKNIQREIRRLHICNM